MKDEVIGAASIIRSERFILGLTPFDSQLVKENTSIKLRKGGDLILK